MGEEDFCIIEGSVGEEEDFRLVEGLDGKKDSVYVKGIPILEGAICRSLA